MSAVVRIGLLFNYTYSYSRHALRGVRRYAETRPDWMFMPVRVEQEHLCWRGQPAPDGLLAMVDTPNVALAVRRWRRPLVNVTAVLGGLTFPRVAVDNAAVARLAADHFLERGLKQLAFVGHPRHQYSMEREAEFRRVVAAAGREVSSFHTRRDRPFESNAQQWYLDRRADRWLLALAKPVGIFAAGDLLGAELAGICQQIGLRVPEDVALVGVSNDELFCELARPPLSSVMDNAQQVGYEAARLLDRLLAGRKPPSQPVLVAPLGIAVRRSSEILAIEDAEVVAAARFIREQAHRPINVSDVLAAVQMSRRSLERRFERAIGHGLAQEITRVRLERCKRLLLETDLKMPAVASSSGFSSARHLASVFQREVGRSPSGFRSQRGAFR